MLIAETMLGKPISLYLAQHNSPFINLLRKQQLRCPSCKSTVLVKSGQKVIPHFAHKSKAACSGFSENESIFHLYAKTELNRWLSFQSLHTELEKTYPQINRRADISVKLKSNEYAVEFQCSPISSELQHARSSDYRQIGVIPFWILPAELVKKEKLIKLTAFYQQFIRYSQTANQFYLITYSPEKQSFTIYHHLMPLSKTFFCTDYTTYPQKTVHFPSFPVSSFKMTEQTYQLQIKMNEKWLINIFKYRKSVRDPLLRKLYENNLSLFEVPVWVGLPLKSNIYFADSPMEWQFYLYLKIKKSKVFAQQQLVYELKQLIYKRVLTVRRLMEPAPFNFVEIAVEEMLHLLLQCHVIQKEGNRFSVHSTETGREIDAQNRKEHIEVFYRKMKVKIIQEYNRR
ncbi:competence protein CoiA family protein [Jeotgalibacillus haloalkalitolerans]|uniref:Competence protein CoiA family protein n=1 Tax=Jeotgalibacillus haloalkalitolerans TaxID=3104292 RepID=A0ABU5KP13_9BACL|nr:competence protein CoiA family protein [Jeotgalibacillus sp. HH7-29]MDZ5713003.1 competence protein CoiA family protein [Jeotgalibacillus sp. HH7-29]